MPSATSIPRSTLDVEPPSKRLQFERLNRIFAERKEQSTSSDSKKLAVGRVNVVTNQPASNFSPCNTGPMNFSEMNNDSRPNLPSTCDPKTSFNESSFKMPVVGSGQAGVGQKFFNRLEIFSDSKMAQGCSDRGPQNCNDLHRQIGGEDLKSFRNNTFCSNNAMNFKQIPNTQIKAAAQSNPQASRKQYLKNFFCCKWWGSQF